MNIQEILNQHKDIRTTDIFQIIEHVKKESLTSVMKDLKQPLSDKELQQIETLIKRYKNDEPIAYLIGQKDFYKDTFAVTPSTLIPRPETEYLVEITRDIISSHKKSSLNILEIGTGSGCISISLLKHSQIEKVLDIHATEIEKDALAVALKNANNLLNAHQRKNLEIKLADIIEKEILTDYDIIISNPPYITTQEMGDLPESVKNYEPETALHGGKNGLDIYKKILNQTKNNRTSKTIYIFEAQPSIMQGLRALMRDEKTFHDQYGRERFLVGKAIS